MDWKLTGSWRTICALTMAAVIAFGSPGTSYARGLRELPAPGVMVPLSLPSCPLLLKGIKIDPNNPLRFDFIFDPGDDRFSAHPMDPDVSRLIRYFLVALTIPEKDLWVNLSPYEKDRIIPEMFGRTEMGRDLVAQDYVLKQMTASLLYPHGATGKKFWNKIYAMALEKYGTTDIPVNTFNKVWIVPEKAVVYENGKVGAAYVKESRLKVMLATDYLADEMARSGSIHRTPCDGLDCLDGRITPDAMNGVPALESSPVADIAKSVLREIVIPVLEQEVNEGKNFATLRQVYQSLILAAWYKKRFRTSLISDVYVDRQKTAGVSISDPKETEKIWSRYVEAFRQGVFNLIEENQESAEAVPRKYTSGGIQMSLSPVLITVATPGEFSGDDASQKALVDFLVEIIPCKHDPGRWQNIPASPPRRILKEWKEIIGDDLLMFQHNGPGNSFLGVAGKKRKRVQAFMQNAIAGGFFWSDKRKDDNLLFHLRKNGRVDVYVDGKRKKKGKLPERAAELSRVARHRSEGSALLYMTNKDVLNLSDIHMGDGGPRDLFEGREQAVLDLLNVAAETQAVVVLNGDIMELLRHPFDEVFAFRQKFFEALERCDKVFYVAGNHDEVILQDRFLKRMHVFSRLAQEREVPQREYTEQFRDIMEKAGLERDRVGLTTIRLRHGPVQGDDGRIWFDRKILVLSFEEAVSFVQRTVRSLHEDIGHQILRKVNRTREDRMTIGRYVTIIRPAAKQVFHFEHGNVPDKFNNTDYYPGQFDQLGSMISRHDWGDLTRWVEQDLFFSAMTFLMKNKKDFDLFLLESQVIRILQLGRLWDGLIPDLYAGIFTDEGWDGWQRYVAFGHTHAPSSAGEGLLSKVLAGVTAWQYINSGTWSDCKEWGAHEDGKTFTWITIDDDGPRLHSGAVDAAASDREATGGIDLGRLNEADRVHDGGEMPGFSLPVDGQLRERMISAEGLQPVIISRQPMNDIRLFLGLNERQDFVPSGF